MILGTITIGVSAASTLPAAGANGIITLTEDVVLTSTLTISADTTIDLAGNDITSAEVPGDKSLGTLIKVSGGTTLTVKDSVGGGNVFLGAVTE